MMMKNTIAKLLAEEDIFVVHKQMETAYFDVKNRELGLPIWKENTMEAVEEELLVCHEIGHALYTPLDMLENSQLRKIDSSVVNVLEDARIEKKVKNKYLGTVRLFNAGYESLIKKDFFGTSGKDLSNYNLIDRINLYFKCNTYIVFSDEEKVWVDRTAKTETPDDVLDLAEELLAWMADNPESMGIPDDSDGSDETDDSGEESTEGSGSGSGDENGESEDGSDDRNDTGSDNSTPDDAESGEDKGLDTPDKSDVSEGGTDGEGAAATPNITAETAEKFGKSLQEARDLGATSYDYVRVNDLDLKQIVVPYKTIIAENEKHYEKDLFFTSTLSEVEDLKKSSKKTVAYMVKEFEMKKSADAYARAAVSKTGSLDMGKLHTYKYNEDLFRKVTTLPGATNHGLVMCLDWSGSMSENLKGTLTQLFNLVWFCRRTKIPFEVYAFSDNYAKKGGMTIDKEAGAFDIRDFAMLNVLSSKMNTKEEMTVMHILWMIASQWGYRDWNVEGYRQVALRCYQLGGTPLNEAIIAMMKIVPKFKTDNNLQKVHSVFLTDGAGNSLRGKNEWQLITAEGHENYGEHYLGVSGLGKNTIVTDPVTNTTITAEESDYSWSWGETPTLLKLLKKRVPDMNIVGFFVAGSGKYGRVTADTLRYAVDGWRYEDRTSDLIKNALKELKKNNVFVTKQKGYDEYYVLPGAGQLEVENFELSDELVGASKAKLKSAFGKSASGRVSSRPLLNKFISMVA